MAKITLSGDEDLDRILREIASEEGAKGINAVMRKATRDAVKNIVLPRVKELIPVDTGFLESQLIVRSLPRSRVFKGHYVGLPDPLFQGDTFYAGFLEFGRRQGKRPSGHGRRKKPRPTDTRAGNAPDSFLRRGLYENEERVRAKVLGDMKAYVDETNRRRPTQRL